MPDIIPSGASALELVQKLIVDNTTPAPVAGVGIFMGYHTSTPDDPARVYMVLPGPDRDPELTAGTIVAIEHTRVDVIVYGQPGEYKDVRNEAARVRYLILSQKEYTALGLRMLAALPEGGVEDLGRDPLDRHQFMVKFDILTEPTYVQ